MTTVNLKPISREQIENLAVGDILYVAEDRDPRHGVTFTPVEVTNTRAESVYPVNGEHKYTNAPRIDRDADPIGVVMNVSWKDPYGSESGLRLSTVTGEAYSEYHYGPVNEAFVETENGGVPSTVTPTYGSSASVAITAKGVNPEDLEAIIREALDGLADVSIDSVFARPVRDHRVDVYGYPDERLIAVNVLAHQAFGLGGSSGCMTRPSNGAVIVGAP